MQVSRRALLQPRTIGATSTARARGDGCWIHVYRTAMACRVEIVLPDDNRGGVGAARDGLDIIDRLAARLTVFSDDSDISSVNRDAAARPVSVAADVFALLARCAQIAEATAGAFDPTTGPLTRCWGFYRRSGTVPADAALAAARAATGMDKVGLDAAQRSVRFTVPGVELNLGAIGKGYALDAAGAALRARGARPALLHAGASSVVAIGGPAGEDGWSIGLRHPQRRDARGAILRLRDCALGTTGAGEQFFLAADGRRYGHVLDPRTGQPAEGTASATVIASTGADADALSTAFFVGGIDLAERYCAAHPGTLAILYPARGPAPPAPSSPVIVGARAGCAVQVLDV